MFQVWGNGDPTTYMSQVSYRIPRILLCRFSVKFCVAACGLPLTFCSIIADYTGKHCWVSAKPPYVPAECSAEGLPRVTEEIKLPGTISRTPKDCSEDSQRRFYGLDNLWSPKGCSKDCHKTIPRIPKDHSAGSPQMICKFQHRFSRKATTDFGASRRIFEINMWHVPYI